ncbi:MAG: Oxaloacetate decarboxylase, gamma chain [Clostridia bacterium]|jgi:sodium pump decarboxylase gamma subunit|nr:Oxaloacetate decarboxylase, gamma chain [Clostridia bacterium]
MISRIFLAEATEAVENAVNAVKEINPNAIVPDDVIGKLMYGFQVTLMGMGMVFIILILLMIMIKLFKTFLGTGKEITADSVTSESISDINVAEDAEVENEDEIAAVISAVIANYYQTNTLEESKYRIRSFKRI